MPEAVVSQQMAIECPLSPNAARCGCACHSTTITPERQTVKMACGDCGARHGFDEALIGDVVVRALEPADLPQLCQLLAQLSTVGDVSEAGLRRFYEDVSASSRHVVAVIENRAGDLVGTATLLVEPKLLHGGSFVGHVEDVVVDQKYRGIGLGRLLITHLVLKAHHAGCYKVILDCEDKNVGFYEKCGLEKHGNCMAVYF